MELLAKRLIRDIPDFPKEGILFKDITPVLADPAALREIIERLREYAVSKGANVVAGIEARGFVLGAPLALALDAPFVPVRKLGKLPGETVRAEYALEYGTNTVEMQKDAIHPGQKVLIVDDLLATGGTCAAAAQLIEALGGEVVGTVFMVELGFLNGRDRLTGYEVHSLIEF
jgi:adenine phosphoribosyltransferase